MSDVTTVPWDVSPLGLLRGLVTSEDTRWCLGCGSMSPCISPEGTCECGGAWVGALVVLGLHGPHKLSQAQDARMFNYISENQGDALCLGCGEPWDGELEPDAREIDCEACGEPKVYAVTELLVDAEVWGPRALATLYRVLSQSGVMESCEDDDEDDEDDEDGGGDDAA